MTEITTSLIEALGPSIAALIVGIISFAGIFIMNRHHLKTTKFQISAEFKIRRIEDWIQRFSRVTSEYIAACNITFQNKPSQNSTLQSAQFNLQKIINNQNQVSLKISELELLLDLRNTLHHEFYTQAHEYLHVTCEHEIDDDKISDSVTKLREFARHVIHQEQNKIDKILNETF